MQYCCICFICIVLFFYVGFIIMIFLCSALRRKHNKWKSFSQMWILYMWKPEKVLTDQSRYKASSYNYYGWAKFSVFYSLRRLSIYILDKVLYWLRFWMKRRIQQWDFYRCLFSTLWKGNLFPSIHSAVVLYIMAFLKGISFKLSVIGMLGLIKVTVIIKCSLWSLVKGIYKFA